MSSCRKTCEVKITHKNEEKKFPLRREHDSAHPHGRQLNAICITRSTLKCLNVFLLLSRERIIHMLVRACIWGWLAAAWRRLSRGHRVSICLGTRAKTRSLARRQKRPHNPSNSLQATKPLEMFPPTIRVPQSAWQSARQQQRRQRPGRRRRRSHNQQAHATMEKCNYKSETSHARVENTHARFASQRADRFERLCVCVHVCFSFHKHRHRH